MLEVWIFAPETLGALRLRALSARLAQKDAVMPFRKICFQVSDAMQTVITALQEQNMRIRGFMQADTFDATPYNNRRYQNERKLIPTSMLQTCLFATPQST
ncbi:MAG: hypothetical protein ACXV2B_03430 [Halobacteriota archaeon]